MGYITECVNGHVTSIEVPSNHKNSISKYNIKYQEIEIGKSNMKVYFIIGANSTNRILVKCMPNFKNWPWKRIGYKYAHWWCGQSKLR